MRRNAAEFERYYYCALVPCSTYSSCYIQSLNFLSMHGKFPAAQWVEHCTANAVRVRMEILYRGTCRFDFFFVSLFFFFLYWFFFRSFAAILYYARLKSSVEYLCIVLFSLYYISQGFLLLIGNFTLSKCTLKLRTCVGTLLNLSVIKWKNKVFSLMPI